MVVEINSKMSLCGKRCSSCIMKLNRSCNGCSMCDISFCKCCEKNKKRCMVICPKKVGSFNVVRLLQLNNKKVGLKANKKYNLPVYIPVMPDKLRSYFDFSKIDNIIGVHGEFLLSCNGSELSPIYKKRGFREALGIYNDEINGIAEFFIKDRALEGFWENREEIYIQIKEQKFHGVITPNFSLYEDAPRVEHLYNLQRVKTVYNEMIDSGIPAILDIGWATEEDLNYWIDEINKSDIKTIAFSFMNVDTRLKASNAWRHYLLGYKILISRIPSDINIIVAGISSIKRVAKILEISGERGISIMNQAAWVNSRNGFSVKDKKMLDKSISKDEIFQMNLDFYISEYNKNKELKKVSV